jgi:NADH:ubiquinone oxidoreductase subunit 3 (subunit A)
VLNDYFYITIFGLIGLCFSLLGLAISGPRILKIVKVVPPLAAKNEPEHSDNERPAPGQPSRQDLENSQDRTAPVEWGAPTENKTWVQFRLRYAVLSLVFISFDMEMVYMFPWGVVFKRLGFVAFGDMFVFVAILAVAILFAWREGAFDWED